jgi:hypothetical protein
MVFEIIAMCGDGGLAAQTAIDEAEALLLKEPKVEIPTFHHFSEGFYTREARMPRGTFVIGHRHKHAISNVLVKGKLLVVVGNDVKELSAPAAFVSEPGTRKAALVLEDVVWLNVHPNEGGETSIEKLEERWIEKSEAFKAHELQEIKKLKCLT